MPKCNKAIHQLDHLGNCMGSKLNDQEKGQSCHQTRTSRTNQNRPKMGPQVIFILVLSKSWANSGLFRSFVADMSPWYGLLMAQIWQTGVPHSTWYVGQMNLSGTILLSGTGFTLRPLSGSLLTLLDEPRQWLDANPGFLHEIT